MEYKIDEYIKLIDNINNAKCIEEVSIYEKELSKYHSHTLDIDYNEFLNYLNSFSDSTWYIVYYLNKKNIYKGSVNSTTGLLSILDDIYIKLSETGWAYCYISNNQNYIINIHYQWNIELISYHNVRSPNIRTGC